MHNIGLPVERLQQSKCGTREESKPNMIVAVPVDVRTREELRCFKQISRSSCRIAKPETNIVNLTTPLHANVFDRAAVQQQTVDLIVERQDELRVDILFD